METNTDYTNKAAQSIDQDTKRIEEARRQEQKTEERIAENKKTEEKAAYILELSRSQEVTAQVKQYDASGNLVE